MVLSSIFVIHPIDTVDIFSFDLPHHSMFSSCDSNSKTVHTLSQKLIHFESSLLINFSSSDIFLISEFSSGKLLITLLFFFSSKSFSLNISHLSILSKKLIISLKS